MAGAEVDAPDPAAPFRSRLLARAEPDACRDAVPARFAGDDPEAPELGPIGSEIGGDVRGGSRDDDVVHAMRVMLRRRDAIVTCRVGSRIEVRRVAPTDGGTPA